MVLNASELAHTRARRAAVNFIIVYECLRRFCFFVCVCGVCVCVWCWCVMERGDSRVGTFFRNQGERFVLLIVLLKNDHFVFFGNSLFFWTDEWKEREREREDGTLRLKSRRGTLDERFSP